MAFRNTRYEQVPTSNAKSASHYRMEHSVNMIVGMTTEKQNTKMLHQNVLERNIRGHAFSMYAKFSEKLTCLTP